MGKWCFRAIHVFQKQRKDFMIISLQQSITKTKEVKDMYIHETSHHYYCFLFISPFVIMRNKRKIQPKEKIK